MKNIRKAKALSNMFPHAVFITFYQFDAISIGLKEGSFNPESLVKFQFKETSGKSKWYTRGNIDVFILQ